MMLTLPEPGCDAPPVWSLLREPQWYALYTRARHEKAVARELARRGLPVLLPLYRTVHRWKDRRKLVELPLFPSYVFVCSDLRERIRILSAPGSVYLVSDSRGPLAITPPEIASVEILARSGRAVPSPLAPAGAPVRVVGGPLAGVEGTLTGSRHAGWVVVAITALASAIRAEVALEDVEPIRDGGAR